MTRLDKNHDSWHSSQRDAVTEANQQHRTAHEGRGIESVSDTHLDWLSRMWPDAGPVGKELLRRAAVQIDKRAKEQRRTAAVARLEQEAGLRLLLLDLMDDDGLSTEESVSVVAEAARRIVNSRKTG
jgi:hypothetical protein